MCSLFFLVLGTKLIDIKDSLESMFDDVVQLASQHYNKSDKAQLTINHGGMREEVFIHLQDLSNISGASIMRRFEKVLNSNEEMCVDDTFDIHVGLMKLAKGGGPSKPSGRALPLYPHLNNTSHSSILNKKAIVEISCCEDEYLCAAKSIVVCMAKLNGVDYKSMTRTCRQSSRGPHSLRRRAEELQAKTGLPSNRPLTVRELTAFEDELNVKIAVIQFLPNADKPCITQCSSKECENVIFLYYSKGHFHAVVNVKAMFPKHITCMKCLQPYSYKKQKSCPQCAPTCCFVCCREECEASHYVTCKDCNFKCLSQECYDAHKENEIDASNKKLSGKSPCELKWKCPSCGKVLFTNKQRVEEHICNHYFCKNCKEHVPADHLCYHRRRGVKATSGKFIFFDFETMQDGVHQCEAGYSPPPRPSSCNLCTEESKCAQCRTCENCKSSSCGRNFHQPNLVVCQSVCDECKDEPLLRGAKCRSCGDLCKACFKGSEGSPGCFDQNCGNREKIFKGMETVTEFCKWLITPAHKDYTLLAHNGKGFDFCFILSYCVTEAHIKPDCIFAGSKIMSLTISAGLNIKFIDSLNFMSMSLKKLPKAFGLTQERRAGDGPAAGELKKGDFPHKMNRREFQNYVGPFPPLSMYSVDRMGKDERAKFIEWHGEQKDKIFDLQAEMLAYCRQDVAILRQACMRFRDLFIEITTKIDSDGEIAGFVDPFAHITIASACMQIYRVNFIKEYFDVELGDLRGGRAVFQGGEWWLDGELISAEDIISKQFVSSSIAQIPAQGYVRNSRHSSKSIAWLEWESRKLGRPIQHARNMGEKVINCLGSRYLADGFDSKTKTVYEFNGCRFHGCPKCMVNKKIKDPRTGFTMKELHEMTIKRTAAIRASGYAVKEIYECQFDQMVKQNSELANFIANEVDVPPRMKIREAFYGGRTSCFTLYHECKQEMGEEIHYADVCSLYPFVNKMAKLPVGHPEIVCRDFDMTLESYFGIAHVKLLPPRDVYVPCLPVRMNGKLTFPLCYTCASEECHEECVHTDEERAITGVWCTPEIMKAISQGYRVVKVYEVYHYRDTSEYDPDTKSGGLFSEQVDLFIKIKTEASGYPEWVNSPAEEDEFIAEFERKVGVLLDKERISKNPALRSIAKICLNSFWGKLGERNNKMKSKFICSTEELEKLTHNSRHDLHRLHIINQEVMVVEYDNLDEFEEDSNTTNDVIAAFTTCFARLELLKHIESVGQNILYCDTDSIIFVTHNLGKNEEGKTQFDIYPQLGDSLGELTNELPPDTHITRFVTMAPKSYSYRCNDDTEVCRFKGVTLNFQNSLRINFESVCELLFGKRECINLAPETKFTRSKFDGLIYNTVLSKTIKPTFNKRRILGDFDTVPFGYVFPGQ